MRTSRPVMRRVARPVMRSVIGSFRKKTGGAPPVYVPKLDFSDSRNSQYIPLISAFSG